MSKHTTYVTGLVTAAATMILLLMGIGALGVIGAEGDRADLMFLGVIAIGTAGAIIVQFEADGMSRTMAVTAGATMLVGFTAIAIGKHNEPAASAIEILGLTAMYAAMFLAAAWLFRSAAAQGAESQ